VVVEEAARRVEARRGAIKQKNDATAQVYTFAAALEVLVEHYPVRAGGVELDARGLVEQAAAIAADAEKLLSTPL